MYSFLDLIDDINWHLSTQLSARSRELGFVVVSAVKFWTDLLIRHFVTAKNVSQDDMLFFVRKRPLKETRYTSQYETHIDVYRNDSNKLPIGDTQIDWEETLYLNVIMQKFEYSITCAVCVSSTSSKQLQIIKRHTQKVFASPSFRSMDCKGDNEQISYPNIFFAIDSYDDLLSEILVREGEMICVELLAKDRYGDTQGVIFLGYIEYEALKRVYDDRASISSRFCRKSPQSYFQGQQRIEFVRMKGPSGKGLAEMAVTKQRVKCDTTTTGSSLSLIDFEMKPTPKPRLSSTSFEMDDQMEVLPEANSALFSYSAPSYDNHDYCNAPRRMSDVSTNLKNYIRGWNEKKFKKSASITDDLCNSISEIETTDFRNVGDSSSYSKTWTMRSLRHSYHFWRENKTACSPPLHAYITYITLPWHHIITDLFSNRQQSILAS